MSAVHGPMPCNADERCVGVVGLHPASASRSIVPLATARPIALMDLIFGPGKPEPRKLFGAPHRTASWWKGSKAASSRSQIAAALAVESCCAQTMAHRPGKAGWAPAQRRAPGLLERPGETRICVARCRQRGSKIGIVVQDVGCVMG